MPPSCRPTLAPAPRGNISHLAYFGWLAETASRTVVGKFVAGNKAKGTVTSHFKRSSAGEKVSWSAQGGGGA
jgi:hypothetical protein